MKIFEVVPAGEKILEILHDIFGGFEDLVNEIRITAGELPEDALSAYNQDQKVVFFDLLNCCSNLNWMEQGVTYVANAWFNFLWSMFHERAHLRQLQDNPVNAEALNNEENIENMMAILEAAADAEANSALLAYCTERGRIPLIGELGFMGAQMQDVLNARYSKFPEHVARELQLQGSPHAGVFLSAEEGKISVFSAVEILRIIIGSYEVPSESTASTASTVPEEGVSDPSREEDDDAVMVTSA